MDIEAFAKVLHESGREAVEKRKLVRNDLPIHPFQEWDELTEDAREGRRMMARYLLNRYHVSPKSKEVEDAALKGYRS